MSRLDLLARALRACAITIYKTHRTIWDVGRIGEGMMDKPHFVVRGRRPLNLTMVERLGNRYSIAKLTDDQVLEIRRLYASGSYSQQDLADQFHVDRSNIGYIVRRKRWAVVG